MSAAGMPDGTYQLGGFAVEVAQGRAMARGVLAGSVLTMNAAYRNVIKFAGTSASDASKMSSANAAYLIGLSHEIGTIEPGKSADLAVLNPETGEVEATFRAGRPIFRR